MPTNTFANLKPAKKEQVRQALLTEFSNHSLASAQVARIVKQAGIARGAFYKYFTDLTDAYQYLYQTAIIEIHTPLTRARHLLTAAEYVDQIKAFVSEIDASPYYELMRQHFQTNEGLLRDQAAIPIKPHTARGWAVMVLCHETIKDCLLQPAEKQRAIERLEETLTALLQ